MAKEDMKVAVEADPKDIIHAEGTVEIGAKPGTYNISHMKKDGTSVVITAVTS